MQRPMPYYVALANTTTDEPHPGWYYITEDENGTYEFHGVFLVRMDAEKAIDYLMDSDMSLKLHL